MQFRAICISFLLLASIDQSIAAPWDSCDTKWKKAWEKHRGSCQQQCGVLPYALKPNCSPDDVHLRTYHDGLNGYRTQKKAESNKLKLTHAVFENYTYGINHNHISSYQVGHANSPEVYFTTQIRNTHPDYTINSITANCYIVANNAIRLFSGEVRFDANLIPGGMANIKAAFISYEYPDKFSENFHGTGMFGISEPEVHIDYSISTKGQPIDSLSIECTPTEVDMGFASRFDHLD